MVHKPLRSIGEGSCHAARALRQACRCLRSLSYLTAQMHKVDKRLLQLERPHEVRPRGRTLRPCGSLRCTPQEQIFHVAGGQVGSSTVNRWRVLRPQVRGQIR